MRERSERHTADVCEFGSRSPEWRKMSSIVELLDIFISEVETSGSSLTSCLLAKTQSSIICKSFRLNCARVWGLFAIFGKCVPGVWEWICPCHLSSKCKQVTHHREIYHLRVNMFWTLFSSTFGTSFSTWAASTWTNVSSVSKTTSWWQLFSICSRLITNLLPLNF